MQGDGVLRITSSSSPTMTSVRLSTERRSAFSGVGFRGVHEGHLGSNHQEVFLPVG